MIALFASAFISTALAVPAYRGWVTKMQPDGSTIVVRQGGDEYYHYWESEAGQQVRLGDDGYWQVVGATPTPATVAERRASNPIYRSQMAAIDADGSNGPRRAVGTKNLAPRGLFILVNFSDKSFNAANTQAAMNDMMNAETYTYNGAIGSARKYFIDQSNGAYTPTFDVVGPVTLSKATSYYGSNDANDNDMYPGDMIIEACKLADSQFGVDFTKYDNDGDGKVDFVYVIYAGKGEADGGAASTIWPHNWNLTSARSYGNCTYSLSQCRIDGKYIDNYACSGELNGSTNRRAGIGTLCHEFSHVLGLPDFYDTNYSTNYDNSLTPGDWDVMDGGSYNGSGNCPPNYSAWEKYFFGWATPTILNAPANITLTTGYSDSYQINSTGTLGAYSSTATQYYIENRQQSGWDKNLPGHGMLVWKVMYNSSAWTGNKPNNTANNPRYTVVSAKGTAKVQGTNYDTYPGSGRKTSYTPVGSYAMTNITENTTAKTVSFLFMGGVSTYTVTFNANSGSCSTTSLTEASAGSGVTLPTATRSGFDFLGWATSSSAISANAGTAGANYKPTGNITLYAVWRQNTKVYLESDLEGVTPNTALGTEITKASGFTRSFTAATCYSDLARENYLIELTVGGVDKTDTYVSRSGSTVTISIPTAGLTGDVAIAFYNDKKADVIVEADGASVTGAADCVEKGTNFQCTITPNTGYALTQSNIEVLMGSTELLPGVGFTYSGTTLTVKNVGDDLYILAHVKAGITWNVQGNANVTYQAVGEALTLPETPEDCGPQVKFVGWTTTASYTHASTAPSPLFTASPGYVTAPVTYYATYAQQTSGGVPTDETLSANYSVATGWTADGCGGSTYWVLKSGATITTPEFDLNDIQSIVVNMRTYGGASYKTVDIKQGSTEIGSLSATSSSLTDYTLTNTAFTNSPSGTGRLTFSSTTTTSDNGPGVKSITIRYRTGGATYVNYNYECFAADKEAPLCYFETTSKTMTVGDTWTQTVTTNSTGAVSYTSSNTSVATVNSTSGFVTAIAEGTATITANVAAAGDYTSARGSYTVTITAVPVVEPDPSSSCWGELDADYYAALDGKSGSTLREAVTAIAYSHHTTASSYNWEFDGIDYETNGNVLDIYSSCGHTKNDPNNLTDCCAAINREHVVPQSLFNEKLPQRGDKHHLFIVDAKVNNHRSAYAFGECSAGVTVCTTERGKLGNSTAYGYSGMVYEVADEYKGDIARAVLYMVVRYATENECRANGAGTTNAYPVTAWNSGSNTVKDMFSGSLATNHGLSNYGKALLVAWHNADPVSEKEMKRNAAVAAQQGNRNPFVDYPELVDYLWGAKNSMAVSLSSLEPTFCVDDGFTPFTVTLSRNSETTPMVSDEETYVLPLAVSEVNLCDDNWPFDGWCATSVTSTTTRPTYITQVTEAQTVYAVYKKDGVYNSNPVCEVAVAPEFAFTSANVTITFGEEISNVLNTNTDGAISYTSSNEAVAAIEGGVVVVRGVGSTTITARAAATDAYLAAEASYTLTVNKADVTITFAYPSRTVNVGGTTTNTATASPAGTITYTSSNTSVATVNSSTGLVTGVAAGTSTITARVAETANYNAAERSYTLTVEAAAPAQHTVRWVVNGVTLRAFTEDVQTGQKPSRLPGNPGNIDCDHPEYVFLGWSADGGVTKYKTLSEMPAVAADVTYVAIFGDPD